MFGGFGGGAPQRFEECYHCYSVAYADKSHLEVSQLQSGRHRSGRTAGRQDCRQEAGPHVGPMNGKTISIADSVQLELAAALYLVHWLLSMYLLSLILARHFPLLPIGTTDRQ